MKIAINGFGRIGRSVLRSLIVKPRNDLEVVTINSTMNIKDSVHLLKYDSVLGKLDCECEIDGDFLIINGKKIKFISEMDVAKISWNGIDLIMECTGAFTSKEKAALHIKSGAKYVMISAPAKEKDVPTVVYGVNDEALTKDMQIFSIGSCTTNCLAPVAKILDEKFGIVSGFMTTIHSYTNDQNIVDGAHKDLRRARAAALSMIPTSTGAAKALSLVLPNLAGKLDGSAIRVPTPNVSVVDLVVFVEKETSIEEINNAFLTEAKGKMLGILGTDDQELVSCDFMKSDYSSIVDLHETKVVNKKCVRILSWYDNEWGFSNRMIDLAVKLKNLA